MRGLGSVTTRRLSAAADRANLERGLHEQSGASARDRYEYAAHGGGGETGYAEGHGVEGEGVHQILSRHDIGNERHPRRVGDDPSEAHEEYEREYMPRLEVSGQDDNGEGEGDDRLIAVNEGH